MKLITTEKFIFIQIPIKKEENAPKGHSLLGRQPLKERLQMKTRRKSIPISERTEEEEEKLRKRRERYRKYRLSNSEKLTAYNKQYYQDHKEYFINYAKETSLNKKFYK